jgi:hypothetical protein
VARPFSQTESPSAKSGRDQGATAKRGDARTLDETFHWIKQQMEGFSGSSHDVSYPKRGYNWHRVTSYGNLEFHDCQITIEKTYQNNSRSPRKVRYTIPLWDLASATYEVDKGSEQFKYTPAVPALFLRSHTKSMHWGRPRSYVATNLVEIEFGRDSSFGKDKINQLAKAFQHLGDLCAAQSPKDATADQSAKPSPQKSVAPN